MQIVGQAILFLALGAFFVWVVLQMAVANDATGRLTAMGVTVLAVGVGAGLVYFLLTPLGKRHHHED